MTADEVSGRQRLLGLIAVLAAIMCFAISFGIIKWPGLPGAVIAWWRLVGSAILWWGLIIGLRAGRRRPVPTREHWRATLPAALFFGIYISVFFTAVTRTSVAHAEFINGLAPLLVIPAGFVFFRERPNWTALRWGALSVVGLAIVLLTGPAKGAATLQGDLLMIIVLLMSVGYYMSSKHARGHGVAISDFMAIVMTVALVTATPVAVLVAGDQLWPLSWQAWVAVALLSVLTGGAGHGLLFYAHRSVPIATISVMQVGQPALSAFWAWVIVGETVTAAQVPGMALVITGMALVVWFSQRPVLAREVAGARA